MIPGTRALSVRSLGGQRRLNISGAKETELAPGGRNEVDRQESWAELPAEGELFGGESGVQPRIGGWH